MESVMHVERELHGQQVPHSDIWLDMVRALLLDASALPKSTDSRLAELANHPVIRTNSATRVNLLAAYVAKRCADPDAADVEEAKGLYESTPSRLRQPETELGVYRALSEHYERKGESDAAVKTDRMMLAGIRKLDRAMSWNVEHQSTLRKSWSALVNDSRERLQKCGCVEEARGLESFFSGAQKEETPEKIARRKWNALFFRIGVITMAVNLTVAICGVGLVTWSEWVVTIPLAIFSVPGLFLWLCAGCALRAPGPRSLFNNGITLLAFGVAPWIVSLVFIARHAGDSDWWKYNDAQRYASWNPKIINVGDLRMTTLSDREIVMTRSVDAPRRSVFDAMSNPDLLKRWLIGPPGCTLVTCENDQRVGGGFRYVWRGAGNYEMTVRGVYLQTAKPDLIVRTEAFDFGGDAQYGERTTTLVLAEQGGVTTISLNVLFPSKEARDVAIVSGIAYEVAAGYDRLEELLNEQPER